MEIDVSGAEEVEKGSGESGNAGAQFYNKDVEKYVSNAAQMFAVMAKHRVFSEKPSIAFNEVEEMVSRVSSCAQLTFDDETYNEIHFVIKKRAFNYMLSFRPDVLGLEVEFLAEHMVARRDLHNFELSFSGALECSRVMAEIENIHEFIAEFTGSEEMADVYINILSTSTVRHEKWYDELFKYVVIKHGNTFYNTWKLK